MSEPRTTVTITVPLCRDLRHMGLLDDRIGARSESYALRTAGGTVLIDPLPVRGDVERLLLPTAALVLTVASHQRAAWSLRRRWRVPVLAPRGSQGLEEEPDDVYGPGDGLPGGLLAVHAPGPREAHCVLLWEQEAVVLFAGDLVMNLPGRGLELLPDAHASDPGALRRSASELLGRPWELLCPGHGEPTRDRPRQRLLSLLGGLAPGPPAGGAAPPGAPS